MSVCTRPIVAAKKGGAATMATTNMAGVGVAVKRMPRTRDYVDAAVTIVARGSGR